MKFDRDTMLRALIQCDVETNSGDKDWYLKEILLNGCDGLSKLTDSELKEKFESVFSPDDPEVTEEYVNELAERCGEF